MTTITTSRINTRVFVAFEGQSEILESLLFQSAAALNGRPGHAEYVFESCEQTLLEYDFRHRYDAIQFVREWHGTRWTIDDSFELGREFYRHLVRDSSERDVQAAIYEATFPALERLERPGPGPGGPGYPGGPGGPGVGNYPRVRVDTSGRGNFSSSFAVNVKITRGFVDSTGRPSVSLRGGNFRITFYGVVDRTDGNRSFSMRITGSDRGAAQGRADVRLNGDRNEVEMINLNGRIGRSNFTGNFNR